MLRAPANNSPEPNTLRGSAKFGRKGPDMTSILFFVLLLSNSESPANQFPRQKDCGSERTDILRNIKPVRVRGVFEPREIVADDDPHTVQIFVESDLLSDKGYASRDGQVIHLPVAAVDGPDADESISENALIQALEQLLSVRTGGRCRLLEAPEVGACSFVGEIHGTELTLRDVGFPRPMGTYGSRKDRNYNWCHNSTLPNGMSYLLCHSRVKGPETVYYERDEDFYYSCKTGCKGAAIRLFKACNWPSESGT